MEEADKELLNKYNDGLCSQKEKAIVESWYLSLDNEQDTPSFQQIVNANLEIWSMLPVKQNKVRRKWPYRTISVAASLFLVLSFALYYYHSKPEIAEPYTNEITPGKIGATFTSIDGKKIKLSATSNGELLIDPGIIHHVSTARGETYQVLLPDGSKVWLNAGSSLTYSTNLYDNGKRIVKLTGEGYFEVKKDKSHPFIVTTKDQEVKVLGTHFNVKAYADEKEVKTTLVEGLVEVTANGKSNLLKPNQQAKVTKQQFNIYTINPSDVVAWKNGYFIFAHETIQGTMNMIGRWYNVDIVYLDDIEVVRNVEKVYMGMASSTIELQQLLSLLERTGDFKFDIVGDKVLVKMVS